MQSGAKDMVNNRIGFVDHEICLRIRYWITTKNKTPCKKYLGGSNRLSRFDKMNSPDSRDLVDSLTMAKNWKKIQAGNLVSLNLPRSISSSCCQSLLRMMPSCYMLISAHCSFSPGTFDPIVGALKHSHNMKAVHFESWNHAEIDAIAAALAECHHVTDISFYGNMKENDAVCDLLEARSNIKNLSVSEIPFPPARAHRVAANLAHVQELTLYYCNLGDAIVTLCSKEPKLTKLDLHDKHVTNKGAFALADFIRSNPFLKELELGLEGVGKEGWRALRNASKANTSIKVLCIASPMSMDPVDDGIHNDIRTESFESTFHAETESLLPANRKRRREVAKETTQKRKLVPKK